MAGQIPWFEVYSAGKVIVVGFSDREALGRVVLEDFRDQLLALAEQHNSDAIAVDLTGVKMLPSGMLGLLVSFHKLGFEVYFFNPDTEIRDVLDVMQLAPLVHIATVDLPQRADSTA